MYFVCLFKKIHIFSKVYFSRVTLKILVQKIVSLHLSYIIHFRNTFIFKSLIAYTNLTLGSYDSWHLKEQCAKMATAVSHVSQSSPQ